MIVGVYKYVFDMEQKDIEKLQKEIKGLQKERDEFLAGWQRAKADFLNYKKEEKQRMQGLIEYVKHEFLFSFLFYKREEKLFTIRLIPSFISTDFQFKINPNRQFLKKSFTAKTSLSIKSFTAKTQRTQRTQSFFI